MFEEQLEGVETSLAPQRSFKNCEAFLNRLRRDFPQIYQKLVGLTKDYSSVHQSVHFYHNEMKKLFVDFPTVIENVNKLFYTDARIKSNDPLQYFQQMFKSDSEKQRIYSQTQQMIVKGNLDQRQQIDLFQIQFRDYPDVIREIQAFQRSKKPKMAVQIYWDEQKQYVNKRVKTEQQPLPQPMELQQVHQHYTHYFYVYCYALQQNREIKNEISLLDRLRTKIFSHFTNEEQFNQFFNEMIHVIHLYTECIITPYEFVEMFQQHSWIDQETIDEIRMATFSRSIARRQQTTLFKPLKDTDFKNAEHVTGSYVRMHPGYANFIRDDPTIPDVLNNLWVSVPFGSEDYSFSIMRKNGFEEQLFKIEDEMYEYDVNINCYKRTIKLLERLEAGENSNAIIKKIIQLKSLQSVYKTSPKEQEEVINLWQKNPLVCSSILKERLHQKCQELVKSKEIANQTWKITQKNNFSRSLDHRSFYFKKNEKQYTCIARFLKEPEDRYMKIQSEYLNSLAQLTTIKPLCLSVPLPTFDPITGPIFSLYIPNHELIKETFEILAYCCEYSNTNDSEWIIEFLHKICHGYFQVEFTAAGQYNFQILKEITQFETNPVNLNYTYLEQFNIDQEQMGISKGKSGNGNKQESESSEEGDFELQRLRSLNSPMITELEVYPPNQLQITKSTFQYYTPQGRTLFGTQNIYVFFRYFYAIYQRLEIAKQISSQTDSMDDNIQVAELKYRLFKTALLFSLKNKEFKYQDYLSVIFGKQAFLFYTIDKLLIDSCRLIVHMESDKVTDGLLNFIFKDYELDPSKTEEIQMNNLVYSLLEQQWDRSDRVVYRFCRVDEALHINYIPYCSAINERQQLLKIQQNVRQYTTSLIPTHKPGLLLKRNIKQQDKKLKNNLEWIWCESMKLKGGMDDIIEYQIS